jgi:group I intron endonuclease
MGYFGLTMAQVYQILNKVNNKSYIGITTKTVKERYNASIWYKCHSINRILQLLVLKYGSDNFEIIILEEPELDKLEERECFYIEMLNSFVPNGYNLTKGGEINKQISEESKLRNSNSNKGRIPWNKNKKHSMEHIERQRNSMKGNKAWNKGIKTGPMTPQAIENSTKAHQKRVDCFDLNGNLLKSYESLKQTGVDGFNSSQVSLVCNGKARSHRNRVFKYTEI